MLEKEGVQLGDFVDFWVCFFFFRWYTLKEAVGSREARETRLISIVKKVRNRNGIKSPALDWDWDTDYLMVWFSGIQNFNWWLCLKVFLLIPCSDREFALFCSWANSVAYVENTDFLSSSDWLNVCFLQQVFTECMSSLKQTKRERMLWS